MSTNNISKDELLKLLKCVRCGSIEDLKSYLYKETVQTGYKRGYKSSATEYMTWSKEFPVCNNCYEKIQEWKKVQKRYTGIFFLIFIPFWILLIIFVINVMAESVFVDNPNYISIIFQSLIGYIIFLLLLLIIAIAVGIFSKRHKKSEDNPIYYMKITFGLPSIKPENSEDWIPFANWAELTLKERILQGNISPTLVNILKTIPKEPQEFNIEKDIALDKNFKKCPTCGNLVNLSKSQICDVCGFEFK